MSIEDAIDLIRSKYEDNKEKKWIQNPVAYTLYEVWIIINSKAVYRPSEPPKEEHDGWEVYTDSGDYSEMRS